MRPSNVAVKRQEVEFLGQESGDGESKRCLDVVDVSCNGESSHQAPRYGVSSVL